MFYIDATFEDLRLIATSTQFGANYNVRLIDNLSGEESMVPLTDEQLQMVLAFNLHADGEPDDYRHFYDVLEPIFLEYKVSANCRPIP